MTRLISPTLLDSFAYYQGLEDEQRHAQARQDLLNRLRGVKTHPTKAMQRGIQFEQDVRDMSTGSFNIGARKLSEKHLEIISLVAQKVKGAERQEHVSYWIDSDTLVHGYIDFLLPGLIIDTKTAGRAYEWGKYLNNCQHLAYLLALANTGYKRFSYLTAIFYKDEATEVVQEDYFYSPKMADALKSRCAEFFDYLTIDPEMSEAYYNRNNAVPKDLMQGAA